MSDAGHVLRAALDEGGREVEDAGAKGFGELLGEAEVEKDDRENRIVEARVEEDPEKDEEPHIAHGEGRSGIISVGHRGRVTLDCLVWLWGMREA